MARDVLPIAGALIGGAIGGPMGAQIGFMVGSIASSYLFPPPPMKGPRLDDRRVQTSSYGMPIPYAYGTIKLAGTIIWAPPLDEDKNTNTSKGAGTETLTYEYFFNGAILICYGQIAAVLRVWADDEVILDRRSTNEGAAKHPNLTYRLYLGDGSDTPDPLIEEVEGAGNVPAWGKYAYIVFEDFPVGRYGNRVPNFMFEVVADFEDAYPTVLVGEAVNRIYIDYATYNILTLQGTPQRIDPITNTVLSSTSDPLNSYLGGSPNYNDAGVQPDGLFYYQVYDVGGLSTLNPVAKIDAYTWQVVGIIGNEISEGAPRSSYVAMFTLPGLAIDPLTGLVPPRYMGAAIGTSNLSGLYYIWDCDPFAPVAFFDDSIFLNTVGYVGPVDSLGLVIDSEGFGWLVAWESLSVSPTKVRLIKFYIDRSLGIGANVTPASSYSLDAYFGAAITVPAIRGMVYDRDENAIIILGNNDLLVKWDIEAQAVTHTLSGYGFTASYDANTFYSQGVVNGELWLRDAGVGLLRIRASDLTVIEYFTGTNWSAQIRGAGVVYDPISDAVWNTQGVTPAQLAKELLHRGDAGTTTLRAIMNHVAGLAGYDTTGGPAAATPDIDVRNQTQVVRGYSWAHMSGRDALHPLLDFFAVDWREEDGLLEGVNRGGTSVATLVDDTDFGAHDPRGSSGTPLDSMREPFRVADDESALPLSLTVSYLDVEDDYAVGSQIAKRSAEAVDATEDRVEQYAIAATADEAIQVAERRLYEAWVGRWKYSGNVHWGRLALNAADPVTITDNSDDVRVRLTSVTVGDNLITALEGVVEDSTALYTSTAVGQSTSGSGVQSGTLSIPSAAQLVIMDTPPLRSADDNGGFYYAVGSMRATDWRGAVVSTSTDGATFTTFDTVAPSGEATIGRASTRLPAPASPFAWDRTNTVTVFVWNATLSSTTEAGVFAGNNWAWLGGEVIAFRDVTDNGDGSYTLSHLLRGRRHTDDMVGSHAAGEVFVLLNSSMTRIAITGTDDLNTTRYYKANSVGFTGLEAVQAFTNTGRRLKPPRSNDIRGARTAAGSPLGVTITWKPRNRLGGRAIVGPVSVGESTEHYEVDVLAVASPDTVIRTLTSDNPAVFYSAEQQLADFGYIPASIEVRVYKLNPTVGRGIAAAAVV